MRAWVHQKLLEMVETGQFDLLARSDEKPDLSGRIDALTGEIEDIEDQARALVLKQAQAHAALSGIYDEQLQSIGDRLDIMRRTLEETKREEHSHDTGAAEAAAKELPQSLEDFWTWDSTLINQRLHSIFMNRRMVMLDHQIVGQQTRRRIPTRSSASVPILAKIELHPLIDWVMVVNRSDLAAYCMSRTAARSINRLVLRWTCTKSWVRCSPWSLRANPQYQPEVRSGSRDVLRDTYAAVTPAYHLNKTHWVNVKLDGSVAQNEIEEWIDKSYKLVVKGLTKAARERLKTMNED